MVQSGLAKSFRAYMRSRTHADQGSGERATATEDTDAGQRSAGGADAWTDETRESGDERAVSAGGETDAQVLRYVYPGYFQPDVRAQVPLFEDETGITVDDEQTPAHATGSRKAYAELLEADEAQFDVGHMDVIWPGTFATEGWARPLDDREGHTDAMFETQVEAVTADGDLLAMPLFTDVNVLYYREDKLAEYGYDEPPATDRELVAMATDILERDDEIDHGFVWQGGQNEGLTIMWLNWLWGRGGAIRDGDEFVVDTSEGVDALRHAVNLVHVHGVTPESVADSSTDENRATFEQGNTLFMRNWPYAVSRLNDGTPVAGDFDVTTLPTHESQPDADNACLGGWNLFVAPDTSAFAAAQELVNWLASADVQRRFAVDHSRLPARKDLYDDPAVREAFGVLDTFEEALESSRRRPATPAYPRLSEIIFTECNAALRQEKTPAQALSDAQATIDAEIN